MNPLHNQRTPWSDALLNPVETGLEVIDLRDDPEFAQRRLHSRDAVLQMEGMKRLASAFVERPETDSAGVW